MAVRILHPASSPDEGPLERALATTRAANAERLAGLFRAAAADDVHVGAGIADGRPFAERLRQLIAEVPRGSGLVVLGSGSVPLAMGADAAAFVATAGSGRRRALTNNRYSSDIVAIGGAASLLGETFAELTNDNALPRWLDERAGYEVAVLSRPRLALDLDSPLDALLVETVLEGTLPTDVGADRSPVTDRIERLRSIAADPHGQLVVAGRTSAATLRWLEHGTASRTRVLVEERGLRTMGFAPSQAPPRSVLGMLLDDRGPAALGRVLAELGGGALVDSRVLLAHRLGADEAGWPVAEDRFASDLLLPDQIGDPWLRTLTAAARDAEIPVLLGGHTLVGPGVQLVLGRRR